MAKHFIADAIKRPGALRKKAHAKKGKKIPRSVLVKLAHSENERTAKQARLALTLRKLGRH